MNRLLVLIWNMGNKKMVARRKLAFFFLFSSVIFMVYLSAVQIRVQS